MQPGTWNHSPYIRGLFPHLFAEGRDLPSEVSVAESLFKAAMATAPGVLRRFGSSAPAAEEIVSDLMLLFLSGYTAPRFDPDGNPAAYLANIIRVLVVAHDRKHRGRRCIPLDALCTIEDRRSVPPIDAAGAHELIDIVIGIWPLLTRRRRDAILAHFGPFLVEAGALRGLGAKSYLEKHRGIRQLRRLLTKRGIVEM